MSYMWWSLWTVVHKRFFQNQFIFCKTCGTYENLCNNSLFCLVPQKPVSFAASWWFIWICGFDKNGSQATSLNHIWWWFCFSCMGTGTGKESKALDPEQTCNYSVGKYISMFQLTWGLWPCSHSVLGFLMAKAVVPSLVLLISFWQISFVPA